MSKAEKRMTHTYNCDTQIETIKRSHTHTHLLKKEKEKEEIESDDWINELQLRKQK